MENLTHHSKFGFCIVFTAGQWLLTARIEPHLEVALILVDQSDLSSVPYLNDTSHVAHVFRGNACPSPLTRTLPCHPSQISWQNVPFALHASEFCAWAVRQMTHLFSLEIVKYLARRSCAPVPQKPCDRYYKSGHRDLWRFSGRRIWHWVMWIDRRDQRGSATSITLLGDSSYGYCPQPEG